jgi:SAM-dependent methyltransferase
MPSSTTTLEQITTRTLAHYQQHAEDFRKGTRSHDVSQNIAALLRHIRGQPPFTILDFGCGPGRDLKAFTRLGHRAVGLDGATNFVEMARSDTGCTVWEQDFLSLDLPSGHFDGVFANASLFHVPSQVLLRVLRQLHATLKPDGVLFCSNPRGTTRKAGMTNAMGFSTTSQPGDAGCGMRASSNSSTITAQPACRARNSSGSPVSGAVRPETATPCVPLRSSEKGRFVSR